MDQVTSNTFSLPPKLYSSNSVLKHMLLVALAADRQSHRLLQESVFLLAGKAEQGNRFTTEEKAFLKVVYTCPWWGGREHGLNEAKRQVDYQVPEGDVLDASVKPVADGVQVALAAMARHYVQGGGRYYPANVGIYQRASVVKDTLDALRAYIRELYTFKRPVTRVSTTDADFLGSKYARQVEARRRHCDTRGFIFKDGTLMLDQLDPGLIALGNRFRITAMTSSLGTHLMTRWRVEGTYRFECFAQGSAETLLPLHADLPLKLPSILGVHLAEQGVAQPFNYFADWAERYLLTPM